MREYYSITELTREFDISTRTLRFYEDEGLVKPVRRGRTRLFKPADRHLIKQIMRGKRLGFSIAEIREIIQMYKEPPGEVGQLNLMLKRIEEKGVRIAYLTLHVGLGTFKPVQVDDISRHQMHSEYYEISEEAAEIINKTRSSGKAICAVGTTSVRVLETVAGRNGRVRQGRGWTDKFIYPPYQFQAVDKLITNFHLPESTLLMLTSAFAGHDFTMEAYRKAVKGAYRFFSYGDAMMIV